ncbi:sugar ABC transporter permease [Herbiconiux sp. KACC 21604]|uniref:carbohydrate ABC transporter permease n=1 Tax=unclassified Herbiconiux TaxID=2618217 RepID=UPI001492F0E3|nr:sugar ABC transporter permease [Herbiconiux sp. SALV-R1]QJU55229.1 sugar ABC transporter permease [Herbiconiux sp. SALV-R1]WPO86395.1 sugar ABC transporter permease [Herbiconiux sp. KACC 21604]
MTATVVDHPTSALRKPRRVGFRERIAPYTYIAPFFLIFLAFGAGPLIYTGWVSLHDWAPLETTHEFIGLDNYSAMLQDPRFWKAIGNTFSIFLLSTIPGLILSLIIASVLNNRGLRAKTFWRMALLVPNITPLVTVSIVFSSLFSRDYGPIAWVLQLLGLPPIAWDADPFTTQVVIAIMVIWRWTGFNALIMLAAMQAVPASLYESAEIDGAGRFRTFFSVTLPLIRPTILFSVVTSTVGGMQIFTEALLFTDAMGGNRGQGLTMTLLVYGQAFNSFHFGYASAIAIALLFIVLMIAGINFLLARLIRSA